MGISYRKLLVLVKLCLKNGDRFLEINCSRRVEVLVKLLVREGLI